MWRFKMCPRCRGDIFIEADMGMWFEKCLQCGYERELKSVVELKKPAAKERIREHKLDKHSKITRE